MEITLERFNEVIEGLEKGEIRVAEKKDGQWVVNKWVKEVILAGFKLGAITDMSQGQFPFGSSPAVPASAAAPTSPPAPSSCPLPISM